MNYANKLEHRCNQEVSLMTLNETFTFQEINLDKKDLSYDIKLKELEAYWNHEYEKYKSKSHCKIFCD